MVKNGKNELSYLISKHKKDKIGKL